METSPVKLPPSSLVATTDPFKDPFYEPAPMSRKLDEGPSVDDWKDGGAIAIQIAGQQADQSGNGVMFLICGFFGLALLVLIPVWDGVELLHDPVWMYMAGGRLPHILIGCAAIPFLFVITVSFLLCCGHRASGARTEQTLLGTALLFILLLGGVLLSVSQPIMKQTLLGKTDLLDNCQNSIKTHPLWMEYASLESLRSTADCKTKFSVEQCNGFKESEHSLVLKQFEETLLCAGFCFYPQAGSSSYPPALFTNFPEHGSCSAMAARNMESFVDDMAKQLLLEGLFLIGATIVQGFLMVLGLCNKKSNARKRAGYGSIQEMPATVDIPSSGDVRRRPKTIGI